jgi:hypothetical protein
LYKWAEKDNFVWLVTEDILDEYKEVLKRFRVRSTLIDAVINLIRERAEPVNVHASFEISPDPKDDPFSGTEIVRPRETPDSSTGETQGTPRNSTPGETPARTIRSKRDGKSEIKEENHPTICARAGVVGWMARRFSEITFKPLFYTDDEADGIEELVKKYGEKNIKDAFEVFQQRDGGFNGAVRPVSLFFKNLHGCSEGLRALSEIGLEPNGTFKPSSPGKVDSLRNAVL